MSLSTQCGSAATAEVMGRLYEVILSRRGGDTKESYTARLFAKGRNKIAQKVGEEATETIVAALGEGPQELAAESADLLYHLLVLWADCGVRPEDVFAELEARETRPAKKKRKI